MKNPFNLTRAADLDDDQINALWVDPQAELRTRLRLDSELPMIILGGKGSGKTHLMRYFSYEVQTRASAEGKQADPVRQAGYLGIYGRCSGLNAERFARKNLTDEQWHALFAFHIELWLGQLILRTCRKYLAMVAPSGAFGEAPLSKDLGDIFDRPPPRAVTTLDDFADALQIAQRDLDLAVNNASFRPVQMPEITISPGRLIFGLPQALSRHVAAFQDLKFTLLIDEYENLPERAQRHINTLLRERENPVTFKIGARLYGMRTYLTYSGDEELREGSEYELLNLDDALRQKEGSYALFATHLCLSRIKFVNGGAWPEGWNDENAAQKFEDSFESTLSPEERAKERLADWTGPTPWLEKLEKHLTDHAEALAGMRLLLPSEVDSAMRALRHTDPLIEKTNTFLLYRAWSSKQPLAKAATDIANSAKRYAETTARDTAHWRVLDKFRDDLRAQMLNDLNLDQSYAGLSVWIRMSDGIARNLVTTLKHVFDWAAYRQESIASHGGITLRSQNNGVNDASEWFLNDAQVLGQDLGTVRAGLNRACSLLRSLRFAEKPPECSLSTFEIDRDGLSSSVDRIIGLAEKWSLIISSTDRPDRNSGADVRKYRVNGMLAPKFSLPIYTRGSIHLSADEVQVIFGGAPEPDFARIARAREVRASPPFSRSPRNDIKEDEPNLF